MELGEVMVDNSKECTFRLRLRRCLAVLVNLPADIAEAVITGYSLCSFTERFNKDGN